MRTPEDFIKSEVHKDTITTQELPHYLLHYAKEFYNKNAEQSWEKCIELMNRYYQDYYPDIMFDYHPEFKKK